MIQEAYEQGISTRSVDDLVKALGMSGVSKSQVSRLCAELDERVGAFLNRFLVALLESVGAVMLALGIQTRVVAAPMVIEMIAAAYVHAPTFSWADRGMEMPLLMGLVALYIALRGAGPLSIDRRIGWAS